MVRKYAKNLLKIIIIQQFFRKDKMKADYGSMRLFYKKPHIDDQARK